MASWKIYFLFHFVVRLPLFIFLSDSNCETGGYTYESSRKAVPQTDTKTTAAGMGTMSAQWPGLLSYPGTLSNTFQRGENELHLKGQTRGAPGFSTEKKVTADVQ